MAAANDYMRILGELGVDTGQLCAKIGTFASRILKSTDWRAATRHIRSIARAEVVIFHGKSRRGSYRGKSTGTSGKNVPSSEVTGALF